MPDDCAQALANIRTHLRVMADYTDESVHGVDTDVMRALHDLISERDQLRTKGQRLRQELDSVDAWASEPHVPGGEARALALISRIAREALNETEKPS